MTGLIGVVLNAVGMRVDPFSEWFELKSPSFSGLPSRSSGDSQGGGSYQRYAEIKAIEDDFLVLMAEKKRLEDERIETEQMMTLARTAQMLAHDFRRPFSLLTSVLDGLTQARSLESVREHIESTLPGVRRSIAHLDSMFEELMTLGSPNEMKSARVPVSEIVRRGVGLAIGADAAAQQRISFDLDESLYVFGSATRLERVVANLVANAFQAMGPADKVVARSFGGEGNTANIVIMNTGSYIPPEDQRRIFQIFYTNGKTSGTGLGLAICRRIVKDHGGVISVFSSKEEGTSFTISLPRTETKTANDEIADNLEAFFLVENDSGRSYTAAVADDEAAYRSGISTFFTQDHGHRREIKVIEVNSAEEVVAMMAKCSVDVVIMDINFGAGKMDGIEAVELLRRRGYKNKVIVHSNDISPQIKSRALLAGADAFLCKPLNGEELRGMVST